MFAKLLARFDLHPQHGTETTQSWPVINETAEQQYEMCPVNVSTANSSINDSLLVSATSPGGHSSGGVDHDLAGDEWQRLLNSAAPLELWQDGAFYTRTIVLSPRINKWCRGSASCSCG